MNPANVSGISEWWRRHKNVTNSRTNSNSYRHNWWCPSWRQHTACWSWLLCRYQCSVLSPSAELQLNLCNQSLMCNNTNLLKILCSYSGCFLGFDSRGLSSSGRGSGLGRRRVSDGGELLLPVFILHESTVKTTFNTPCELLGGISGEEAGGALQKLGY